MYVKDSMNCMLTLKMPVATDNSLKYFLMQENKMIFHGMANLIFLEK